MLERWLYYIWDPCGNTKKLNEIKKNIVVTDISITYVASMTTATSSQPWFTFVTKKQTLFFLQNSLKFSRVFRHLTELAKGEISIKIEL